jgi:hypothetical protein
MNQFDISGAVAAVANHISLFFPAMLRFFVVGKFGDWLNWPAGVVVLLLVVAAFATATYKYRSMRSRYGKRELVDVTSGKLSYVWESLRLGLRMFAYALLILALLDPYIPGAPIQVPSGDRDYAVCIADNKGMAAIDELPENQQAIAGGAAVSSNGSTDGAYTNAAYGGAAQKKDDDGSWLFHEKGSRLDFVRNVIKRMLGTSLARSNVALIAFQGESNVIVPMTDSPDWIVDQLDPTNKFGLRVGTSSLVGKGKVDGKVSTIASCLETARKILEENGDPKHKKFIIYFGNGDDISAPKWLADEEAELKKANIEGAIFGVGGAQAPIPTYKGDDEQFAGYYNFRNGTQAMSGYNEKNLQDLADATGWPYRHLDPKHVSDKDLLNEDLTDSRTEIGRWHLYDYMVELALIILLGTAIAGRRRGKGQIYRSGS